VLEGTLFVSESFGLDYALDVWVMINVLDMSLNFKSLHGYGRMISDRVHSNFMIFKPLHEHG
jgi:hypothetical protein